MIEKLSRVPKSSWEYFSEAIVHLGMPVLNKIFSGLRSKKCPNCGHLLTETRERTFYGWAADPDICETARKNPIDRIRTINREFIKRGEIDVPRGLLILLAEDLGGRFEFNNIKPGQESFLEEAIETTATESRFHLMAKEHLKSGKYSLSEVRASMQNVKRELDEDYEAFLKELENKKLN